MKHVYFIYAAIPRAVFDGHIKYLLSNIDRYRYKHEKMFGLYAWTTKKKFVLEFYELRNKQLYTLIEKDFSDEEFKEMKSIYGNMELKLNTFERLTKSNKNKSIDILTTVDEYRASVEEKMENLYEFGPEVNPLPPTMFKTKVRNALERIGYIHRYIELFGSDDEKDFMEYNKSFGLSSYGMNTELHMNDADQVGTLLYLFGFMFYGEEHYFHLKDNKK